MIEHGSKSGHLTLVKKLRENLWLAVCDCGGEVAVNEEDFATGKITKCGNCKLSPPRKYPEFMVDPIGKRFGSLTVLKRGNRGLSDWVCKCDCGTLLIVRRRDLLMGKVTSCDACKDKRDGVKKHRTCCSCLHNPRLEQPIHYCEVIGGWVSREYTCSNWKCRARGLIEE